MNYKEARKLAADTATWFFQNGTHLAPTIATLKKESASPPKFSEQMWAKLMTEAIVSFHEGLDLEPSNRRASNGKELFDAAVDLVGPKAFHDMAFMVSAAGARRPIEEELEQSFEQMTAPGGGGEEGFTGVEGLSGLISTDADAKAYGQASTIIMQVESAAPSQGTYHQSAQQLQGIASSGGLSQPFARALSSLGAEYMVLADELTRQSGEGQQPSGGPGTSGLPTGIGIQGFRQRAIFARKQIIEEALNG
jgi:hypothetical protein